MLKTEHYIPGGANIVNQGIYKYSEDINHDYKRPKNKSYMFKNDPMKVPIQNVLPFQYFYPQARNIEKSLERAPFELTRSLPASAVSGLAVSGIDQGVVPPQSSNPDIFAQTGMNIFSKDVSKTLNHDRSSQTNTPPEIFPPSAPSTSASTHYPTPSPDSDVSMSSFKDADQMYTPYRTEFTDSVVAHAVPETKSRTAQTSNVAFSKNTQTVNKKTIESGLQTETVPKPYVSSSTMQTETVINPKIGEDKDVQTTTLVKSKKYPLRKRPLINANVGRFNREVDTVPKPFQIHHEVQTSPEEKKDDGVQTAPKKKKEKKDDGVQTAPKKKKEKKDFGIQTSQKKKKEKKDYEMQDIIMQTFEETSGKRKERDFDTDEPGVKKYKKSGKSSKKQERKYPGFNKNTSKESSKKKSSAPKLTEEEASRKRKIQEGKTAAYNAAKDVIEKAKIKQLALKNNIKLPKTLEDLRKKYNIDEILEMLNKLGLKIKSNVNRNSKQEVLREAFYLLKLDKK